MSPDFCSNEAFVDPYNCSQYLDVEGITQLLETKAAGKKSYGVWGFDNGKWENATPNETV